MKDQPFGVVPREYSVLEIFESKSVSNFRTLERRASKKLISRSKHFFFEKNFKKKKNKKKKKRKKKHEYGQGVTLEQLSGVKVDSIQAPLKIAVVIGAS